MQLRTEGLRPYLMGKVLAGTNSCRLLEKVLWQCCADLHKACKWTIKQLAGWQVLKHKLWRREIVFRDSFVSSGSSPSLKAYVFQIHIFNSAYLNSATPLVVSEAVSQNLQHPSFNLQHEIILFDKLTHERQRHTYSPMSERARAL